MNGRALLGVLGGLLLALPLALLLGSVMLPSPRGDAADGWPVSPVLDTEERTRRVTYRRHCTHNSRCEAPLGCFFDLRIGAPYCTDSQCATDQDCPQEQVCRGLTTVGGGRLVRFCTPVGVRQEGERCIDLPRDKESACSADLLCGGNGGWCARPCRKGDATSCPEGFFCADVPPQPVCLPTCEGRVCPEGQTCVRFEDGVSACAMLYGPHCQQSPCPQGLECEVLDAPKRPGRAWLSCVERCGDGFPPCPEGRGCDGWSCEPSCDPEKPDTCAEGYRCQQLKAGVPWLCLPDW